MTDERTLFYYPVRWLVVIECFQDFRIAGDVSRDRRSIPSVLDRIVDDDIAEDSNETFAMLKHDSRCSSRYSPFFSYRCIFIEKRNERILYICL